MSGVIKGKGDGKWGRVTINRDGSMTEKTFTIATEGTMEGKLVAARGFTTKKIPRQTVRDFFKGSTRVSFSSENDDGLRVRRDSQRFLLLSQLRCRTEG